MRPPFIDLHSLMMLRWSAAKPHRRYSKWFIRRMGERFLLEHGLL